MLKRGSVSAAAEQRVSDAREANQQAALRFWAAIEEVPRQAGPEPCVSGDASGTMWVADPDAMPESWPEREYRRGDEAAEAARAELKYISRRRADAEDGEMLAREAMPTSTWPPRLEAQPAQVDTSWPEGAPPPPVSIEQLFYPGVYGQLQRALRSRSEELRVAEWRGKRGDRDRLVPGHMPEVYEAKKCQPGWARERVWDTRDPANCVPVVPFSKEEPPKHELDPEFFVEWGARLGWPDKDMLYRAAWEGGTSGSTRCRDTVIHTHHLGLRGGARVRGSGYGRGVDLGRLRSSPVCAFAAGA